MSDDPTVRAVARSLAAIDHFAFGGKGGAPDFLRALEREGFTVRRRRRLSMRMRPVVGFTVEWEPVADTEAGKPE